MTSSDDRGDPRRIEDFLGDPTRDRAAWKWLWEGDHSFPVQGRPSGLGRLVVALKKLLRPFVRLGGADLFDRQRVFNLILLEDIKTLEERHRDRLVQLENTLRGDVLPRVAGLEVRSSRLEEKTAHLEAFLTEGLEELMRYNDALYSRVDQKLDAYRREARDFVSTFAAGLAEGSGSVGRQEGDESGLKQAFGDWQYQELEKRFRGSSEEIRGRVSIYLPLLAGRRKVLDLGCGRGEALGVFADSGIGASGVDASDEMVRLCREQGFEALQADLLADLAGRQADSLDGVVSFHVIEHFSLTAVDRLVKLAWRALEPGGVLILETPNPLSLTMAANLFWRDPTHVRPVHPDLLRLSLDLAGFDQVEIRPLHPFPESERLPEIDLEGLDEPDRAIADRVNRLRDALDDALFGHRDYAAIGIKGGELR